MYYKMIGNEVEFFDGSDVKELKDAWRYENRKIACFKNDDICVSTVFLVIDHSRRGDGKPVLFETAVFEKGEIVRMERYCTRAEAEAGHKRVCKEYFGIEWEEG